MYLEALHVMYALRNVNRPSEECKETIQLGSWPSGEFWETTQSGQVATQPSGECRETAAAETDTETSAAGIDHVASLRRFVIANMLPPIVHYSPASQPALFDSEIPVLAASEISAITLSPAMNALHSWMFRAS